MCMGADLSDLDVASTNIGGAAYLPLIDLQCLPAISSAKMLSPTLIADSLNIVSRNIEMSFLYWGIVAVTVALLLNRVLQYGMRTQDLPPGNVTVVWQISPDCCRRRHY